MLKNVIWNCLISLTLYLNLLSTPSRKFAEAAAKCIPFSSGCGCKLDDGSGSLDLSPMTQFGNPPM